MDRLDRRAWVYGLSLMVLVGCVYSEGPDGRYAHIDLPTQNTVTVNKTVRIYAPPGTTVVYGDTTPLAYPTVYGTQTYPGSARRGMVRTYDGLCLDIAPGQPPQAGSVLMNFTCHGRNSQQIQWYDGRMRVAGWCLEAVATGQNTAMVVANDCRNSQAQYWHFEGQRIRSAWGGLCLDSGTGLRTPLQLNPCQPVAGQTFRY